MAVYKWAKKPIKNILLDINGVLFESGEDHAIEGSVEALKRLIDHGFKFCLVTNECTTARRLLAQKLNQFGFESVTPAQIISPAPAACQYLQARPNLRPRLHIWDGVLEDFQPILDRTTKDLPLNCLVVGNVKDKLSRQLMDESLELMLNSPDTPQIISLGAGRYYKSAGHMRMNTGAYVKAFEYCLGVEAMNVGKPHGAFFQAALNTVGGIPEETVMIGDDIVSDIGGAQEAGMRGFLVRTGKYKRTDETESGVKADHVFNNLRDAIEILISQQQ